MPQFIAVAVPTVLRQALEYRVDEGQPLPPVGARVCVPYRKQLLVAVVLKHLEHASYPAEKLRPVETQLDQQPIFDPHLIQLCEFAAQYYQHPVGEVFHAALPTSLRAPVPLPDITEYAWVHTHEGKGLPQEALKRSPKQQHAHQQLLSYGEIPVNGIKALEISSTALKALEKKQLVTKQPLTTGIARQVLKEHALSPTSEQSAALNQIKHHQFNAYVLEGATGSGKTEVYLQTISRTLNEGKQVLVLVPEIGLTPQTLARFKARFAVPIVELHSNVANKQRAVAWLKAAKGQAQIVIGTRLAILTPMPKLGMIIVDEEHDASFKQQEGFRYSARDLAVIRGHQQHIPVVLGSATPSLETLQNAIVGRYQHIRLTQRAGGAQTPHIQCLNMLKESSDGALAHTTLRQLEQTLSRGEQAIVFINRRGYAPALLCPKCGWAGVCNACDARLTLHSYPNHLRCHHCDARKPVPAKCPSCHHAPLEPVGQGTARVEEQLQAHFPATPVLRVDQDSMQRKHAMQELSDRLLTGEPCILVGTQMLAKGHHFPKVTLVVLLDVDQALFSGDFRALERLGQQVTQVAGRSGRGDHPGSVLLQSHQADHPLLTLLLGQGYHQYARQLLINRQASRLPPYWAMAILRAESKQASKAQSFLTFAAGELKKLLPPAPNHTLLGPLPCLIEKRQDRFRFQLQLTCLKRSTLRGVLPKWIAAIEKHPLCRTVRWAVDVDPVDTA